MRRLFGSGEAKDGEHKASSRSDGKDDDDDDDAALVAACARFCLGSGSLDAWHAFMDAHEGAFAAGEEKQTGEHRLEHTRIHADFCALVDGSLDGWLARRGADAPGFKAACERLAAGGGDDLVGTFVTLMLMALEYEAFADVMRDREKRRYFFAVLARWRDAL